MSGLFARHTGRRCRRHSRTRGSLTGWSLLAALAAPSEASADDFTRPRTTRPTIHPYERTPR
jgi:hypothetical protein